MAYTYVKLGTPYIDEDALAERCPQIHHYTLVDRLSLIFESGGLWATDYRVLNDTTEFRLAQSDVAERIYAAARNELKRKIEFSSRLKNRIRSEHGSIEALIREDAKILPRAMCSLADQYMPMHVTSFAHHKDGHQQSGGREGIGHPVQSESAKLSSNALVKATSPPAAC